MNVKFSKSQTFYIALKKEVDNYFKTKNINKTGDVRLYIKTAVFLLAGVYLYLQLVFDTPHWAIAIPMCILLGFDLAFIGFNIMHDACHESYSRNKNLNYAMGLTMNLLGSSAHIWKTKHNVVHHTYTNIDGIDDDIIKVPLFRWTESQPKKAMHKYQHIYAFIIYALTPMLWALIMDMQKYFTQKVVVTQIAKMDLTEHIIYWVSKVFYVTVYIVIPFVVLPTSTFFIGFFLMNAIFGLTLSLVFQLAHVVENTDFTEATNNNLSEQEWAVHQLATTSNFATKNKIVSWFLGGLNFQVEHHLFARVSHVHYPAINDILMRLCVEYNIPYKSYPTMTSAFVSHYRYVKRLGNEA